MALAEYKKKRKFDATPEPSGEERKAAKGNSFVVQKHDATQLHYDFRLEIGGVLVSWAVPKGPSMNPAEKRLAMMTEDHPLDYASFEGTIPEGNYGAGTVMVWDRGTFEAEGGVPAERQLAAGEIKFTLHGEKLRGSFVLVNTGRRSADPRRARQWLLIKHRDEFATKDWDINALDWSVLTGRSLEEIASGKPARRRARG
jgi:bifunctional non-homologous end joining protein LigD